MNICLGNIQTYLYLNNISSGVFIGITTTLVLSLINIST